MPQKKEKQVVGLTDPSTLSVTFMKASPVSDLKDPTKMYTSQNYMNVSTGGKSKTIKSKTSKKENNKDSKKDSNKDSKKDSKKDKGMK